MFTIFIGFFLFSSLAFSGDFIQANLDNPFQLTIGQTVQIESENLEIKFQKIIEDSRCPDNVTCFWRGVLIIELLITKDNQDLGAFPISDYDLPALAEKDVFSEINVLNYKIKLLSEKDGVVEIKIKKHITNQPTELGSGPNGLLPGQ